MKDVRSFWPVGDLTFRWYIVFKKTFMDGTLKPSVLNGQRLDVEFKMAVTLGCHENSDPENSDLRPRKLRPLEI